MTEQNTHDYQRIPKSISLDRGLWAILKNRAHRRRMSLTRYIEDALVKHLKISNEDIVTARS